MNLNDSDFDSTVDKCADLLPRRARRYLIEHTIETCLRRFLVTLRESSTTAFLQEAGVRNYAITRRAIEEILNNKNLSTDTPNLFETVDPSLRGKKNPFVEILRSAVMEHLRNRTDVR